MKNKFTLFSLAILFSMNAMAQKDVYLTIRHMLGTNTFAFNQPASNDLGDNFSITRVDYYLSKFTIIHDGGTQTVVPAGTYILAKGSANVAVKLGNFNVTNVEGIKFYVGVDAPTNNDDPAQWTAPHPLAPQSPSMHWGWASGYRFVALEGKAGASLNTTFQMHALGNANYFTQTVMAAGVANGNDIYINLDADYVQAVQGINVAAGPIDHGVDATDLDVLHNFRDDVFSPGPGFASGLQNDITEENILLYPNPGTGNIQLLIPGINHQNTLVSIYDMKGQKVNDYTLNQSNALNFSLDTKGVYLLQIMVDGNQTINKKLVIE